MKLLIPQRYIKPGELDEYELLIYVYMKALCLPDGIEEVYITNEQLSLNIFGDKVSYYIEEKISTALLNLIDRGIFDGTVVRSGVSKINVKSLEFKLDDYFAVVYTEDLEAFRDYHYDIRTHIYLFRFYLLMLCSLNNSKSTEMNIDGEKVRGVIGNMSQQYFAEILDVSIRTIKRWIKSLTDADIIYVYNVGYNQKNYYGRYIHKEAIDNYFSKHSVQDEFSDLDMEELFG